MNVALDPSTGAEHVAQFHEPARSPPTGQRSSVHPASFRDPSGFVFRSPDGRLLRQVNRCYEDDFRHLLDSGLYDELVGKGLLVEHEEVELSEGVSDEGCHVLEPRELPFISYPYEWSFSALQDAALLTLDIQRRALARGMTLKDASAYNVQFVGTRPVFIDTLSLERHDGESPWQAYGQFCRHFLAPLALMAYRDVDLGRLSAIHLDGVPLDLASKLLPARTRFFPGLAMHLHLHASLVRRNADAAQSQPNRRSRMSREALLALIDNLDRLVRRLSLRLSKSTWSDYYENNSYGHDALRQKRQIVGRMLDEIRPESAWDLGANTGVFSRLAAERGAYTCSFELDALCVEQNFRQCREANSDRVLPLRLDLTNPSAAIGWAGDERQSLAQRGPCDTALALALVHHLAIGNNVPLPRIAEFLAGVCRCLVIEWVPKEDPQVRRLLATRADIFLDYHREGFEAAVSRHFEIVNRAGVGDDGRVLYLLKSNP